MPRRTGKVGVYVDDLYRITPAGAGVRVSTDRSFMTFAAETASHLGGLLVFGRVEPSDEPADHELPAGTEIVALPMYEELTQLGAVARALPGTARAMWRELSRAETLWVFGPHPFGLLLCLFGLARRKRVVLGVRQDTMPYFRSRARGERSRSALALAWGLDRAYRLLSRRLPITVVGEEIARGYGSGPTVLAMTVSLVRDREIVTETPDRSWDRDVELLTVGRVEQEKNPFLLVELMARLERDDPGRYRLTVVGRGPLEHELARRVASAGLADRITLAGYVPFGEPLLELYRSSHAFVHVSLTEGVPQVLLEAFASGLPVVATDVGGVAAAVGHGDAALLVPPGDAESLARAVEQLRRDPRRRRALAQRGLERVRTLTLEAEAARVASFLRGTPDGAHASSTGAR